MAEETTAGSTEDAEVAKALGLGPDDDQHDDEAGDSEGSEGQEAEGNDDGEDVAALKRQIATLKREAAERRIREREAKRQTVDKTDSSAEVEAARKAGREEALQEVGVRLAGAEVRAALKGIVPDDQVASIVEDLNISRYVGDDGEPDMDAIGTLRDKIAALAGGRRKTPGANHGRQGGGTSKKSNAEQFAEALGLS